MKTEASVYDFLQVPPALTRGNVTTMVTDTLRRAIVSLDIKPGTPIDKSEICARLGVSRFPVSEALGRLRDEGLVDILPQRGSIVSLIRISEILEYILIRRALETEAVELAAISHDDALIVALRNDLQHQRRAVQANDAAGIHDADLAFHQHIADALNLPKLKAVIDSARANLDRARRLIRSPSRRPKALAEHVAIVDAIEAGDPAAAAQAMRRHLDNMIIHLLKYARRHPEQFADGAEDFSHRFAALFPER